MHGDLPAERIANAAAVALRLERDEHADLAQALADDVVDVLGDDALA